MWDFRVRCFLVGVRCGGFKVFGGGGCLGSHGYDQQLSQFSPCQDEADIAVL